MLIVKAVNLILISGRGLAIPSAKEEESGFIKELISCLSRTNVRAFHENPNRIHTEFIFVNPESAYHRKSYVLSTAKIFESP